MMIAILLTSIVLLTSLGGHSFPWDSPVILGLAVLALAALIGFVADIQPVAVRSSH